MTAGTTETYREVVARLSKAQKGSRNAPAYSRWVNRPLGRRIAAAAYLRGLTPNRVTGLSAVLTFGGLAILVAVPPRPAVGVLIGAMLVLGYAFDAADGQLARLTGGGSLLGEWLDHVVDSAKNVSVHLAVLVSWYRFDRSDVAPWLGERWLLALPLVYAVVATVYFFAMILTDQLRRLHGAAPAVSTSEAGRSATAPLLRSLATLPNDYGLLAVVFMTVGLAQVFAVSYAVLLSANVVFLAVALARWSRELRQSDQHR